MCTGAGPQAGGPRRLGRLFPAAGAVGLLLAVSLLLVRSTGVDDELAKPGLSPAPDFRLTTLDGSQLTLADLRGRAVVLSFWGSWCTSCRAHMPYFERAYRANRDRGVAFVGAAVEDQEETSRSFVQEASITFPIGLDDGSEIARTYGLQGLPSTAFITRNGSLYKRWPGLIGEPQLTELIDQIAR